MILTSLRDIAHRQIFLSQTPLFTWPKVNFFVSLALEANHSPLKSFRKVTMRFRVKSLETILFVLSVFLGFIQKKIRRRLSKILFPFGQKFFFKAYRERVWALLSAKPSEPRA
jgi:hypothetical protein